MGGLQTRLRSLRGVDLEVVSNALDVAKSKTVKTKDVGRRDAVG